jgi:predicted component of type VI protein secretion system
MKRIRLFIIDGSEVVERTYSELPVRIGRHATNECQIVDERVSRFHAQIERDGDALVLRDLGSHNGTLLLERTTYQMLRGRDARSSDGSLAFFLGAVRVLARTEEDAGVGALMQTPAPSTFVRESAALAPERGSGVRLRFAIHDCALLASGSDARDLPPTATEPRS